MDELDRLREQGGKTSAVIRLFQCITGPRVRRQYFLGLTNEVRLAVQFIFCCGWSLIRDDHRSTHRNSVDLRNGPYHLNIYVIPHCNGSLHRAG